MTAVLANALCEEYDVDVISLKPMPDEPFFSLDRRVHLINLPCKTQSIPGNIRAIRRHIRKNRIDWLICVDVGTGIFGVPAAFCTKTKVITWEHGNFYNNWGSRYFPYFRRFAAKRSDGVVVLTEKDRQNYLAHIKTRKPIHVIPNPVERHEFCYAQDSKTILSAGLLLPIKGFDVAIEIASIILKKHPDWNWVIFGEGPEREKLEGLIRERNLEERVLLPGSVQNMPEQYQKASLYVMTSQMEGLPMVLLEAKSWGLPIVSFDIMTGPGDIVRDGVNGYLTEPGDVEKMAERLDLLMTDQELRQRFSQETVLDMEKFSFENILAKWREILKI